MRRPDLVPDCGGCAALCCVATSFAASEDFAFTKAAGVACRYLRGDHRCGIHDELAARGFGGCAVYDCHGAGPRVTRAFAGEDERRGEAFMVLRRVHELLWQLTEAARLCGSGHEGLAAELGRAIAGLDAIACGPGLFELELRPYELLAHGLLRRVGAALGGRAAARRLVVLAEGDLSSCSCRR